MGLRLIPRGKNKIWYVDDRLEGLRIRDCLGTSDKRLAQRKAIEIEFDVMNGVYKLSHSSFEHCVEKYLENILPKKSKQSQVRYEIVIRIHLLPVFQGKTIKDIVWSDPLTGESLVRKFLEQRSRLPESSLKKIVRVLRDIIMIGYPDFKMPTVNYFNKGFYQKQFLTESDVLTVVSYLEEQHQTFALVMAYTGLRLGDAINLTWAKVNFKLRMIVVLMGKTGEIVRIPISPKIMGLLKVKNRIRRINDDRVFSITPRAFQKAWNRASKKAGFEWARPHDLRHFFCSYLLNKGVDHMTVATLSGHKSVEVLKKRYGHFDDDTLRRAMDVFGDFEKEYKISNNNISFRKS